MAGSYGTLIMIGVIAAIFFAMSPGIFFNYSIDQDNDLVESTNRSTRSTTDVSSKKNQNANKVQVATHAIAFAIVMTFAFPIIKETLGKM